MSVETVRLDPTRALVRAVGELDLGTAAPLWAVLQGHLAAGRRFLRLDLSGVTFLDATALSGITAVHRDLLAQRGTLVITGVRPLVARVLRMTGLDDVLFIGGPRADDDTFDGTLDR
jgi:anti-anti-sigma factor